MTRPQRDTVAYFPHDANASERDTLTILQGQFGNDGYAFWFKLLERLCSTEGHYIDCNDNRKVKLLAARSSVTSPKALQILDMLADLKAIDPALWLGKIVWCQHLVENVADVYKNRRRDVPQKPITTGSNAITTERNSITTGSNPQSKVNNSKEYISLKEYPNVKLTSKEYEDLIQRFGDAGARDRIENFGLYIGSKGDKYKSHHCTILAWERRDRKSKPDTMYQTPEEIREELS